MDRPLSVQYSWSPVPSPIEPINESIGVSDPGELRHGVRHVIETLVSPVTTAMCLQYACLLPAPNARIAVHLG